MLLVVYQWNFLLNFCFVKVEIRLVSVKIIWVLLKIHPTFMNLKGHVRDFCPKFFSDCFVYNASVRHSLLSTKI